MKMESEQNKQELTPEEVNEIRLKLKATNLYLQTILYGTAIIGIIVYIIKTMTGN